MGDYFLEESIYEILKPDLKFQTVKAITRNIQRAISRKMFLNFHHIIYLLSSISCTSLKLLAVMFFFEYQVFYNGNS